MTPDQFRKVREAHQALGEAWMGTPLDGGHGFVRGDHTIVCHGPRANEIGLHLAAVLGDLGAVLRHVEALERQLAERTSG
jgi:hypothetical protein